MKPQMSKQKNCFIDTTLPMKGKLSVRYKCGLQTLFGELSSSMSVGEWFIYSTKYKSVHVEHLILIDCTDNSVLHFFVWFLRGRRPTRYIADDTDVNLHITPNPIEVLVDSCVHTCRKKVTTKLSKHPQIVKNFAWEVWSGTVHPKAGDTNQCPPAKPDDHPSNLI